LLAALPKVSAEFGYAHTSVGRITSEASISRATFYEHFSNRDACFRAVYREAERRLLDRVHGRLAEASVADRPVTALQALVEAVEADPLGTRFVLLESLGAGPVVRRERERFSRKGAKFIEWLSGEDHGGPLQAPPAALMGGIAGVIALRLFDSTASPLEEASSGLLAWLRSYAVDPGSTVLSDREWSEVGRGSKPRRLSDREGEGQLPRGRSALAPAVVEGVHQDRIVAAVARLSREKGFAAMTVAEIVRQAEISRDAFYRCYAGKDHAFRAAQEVGLQESAGMAASAFVTGETWIERVWNGLDALLAYTASQEDLAFVDLVESYAAGPAAIARSVENRLAFRLFLEEGYHLRPEAERLPRICSEAISAAILELLRREVAAGRTANLRRLLPEVVHVALAPFLGADESLAFVAERWNLVQYSPETNSP
jgi:AcrR family transcriptional regulator